MGVAAAMNDFVRGVWVVAYREFLRLLRDRARFVSAFAMPLLFLVIFGAGFNRSVGPLSEDVDYIKFVYPGLIAQTVFMVSMFAGLSVVWDREFGFLRELLIAPISRSSIVFGKILGAAGIAVFQGLLMLVLAPVVGVPLSVLTVLKLAVLLIVLSVSLSSIGMALASRLRTQQGFQIFIQIFMFPAVFISGVLFPVNDVPRWLEVVSKVNPLTYGVDAVRQVFLTSQTVTVASGEPPILGIVFFSHTTTVFIDIAVLGLFGAAMFFIALWMFNRQA
ncbi:MAG: ABC transporter permease [Chloroflexi bacterium]|nr:ABC transporter permease [Chloroflexota bacterium]